VAAEGKSVYRTHLIAADGDAEHKNSIGLKTATKDHGAVVRALDAAGNAAPGVSHVRVEEEASRFEAVQHAAEAVVAEQSRRGPSLAERLCELTMLHAEGILSDQEYAESKARLLATL